jgi:hypothetical protein
VISEGVTGVLATGYWGAIDIHLLLAQLVKRAKLLEEGALPATFKAPGVDLLSGNS